MLNKNSKIFLAGHTGLVGSAILRFLKNVYHKFELLNLKIKIKKIFIYENYFGIKKEDSA